MPQAVVADRILGGHDPADGIDETAATDHTAVLARILDTPGDPGRRGRSQSAARRRSHALWLTPVGMAAVLVAIVVTQLGLPRGTAPSLAQAATPPPLTYQAEAGSAREALLAVAGRIRAAEAPASSSTGYRYVRTQSWDLSTRIDGVQVRSAVLPEIREVWRAPDGSGRIRTVAGEPQFPSEDARQAWEEEGRPIADPADETFPAGGLGAMYPADLPTGTTELAALLATSHPVENGPAETLVAIADLCLEQVPPAPVRAALLDVLASTPDLYFQGRTVDRAGRPALAVAVDSAMSGLPTRYTLLIDPTDGRLLGQEKTLTGTAGALGVPFPALSPTPPSSTPLTPRALNPRVEERGWWPDSRHRGPAERRSRISRWLVAARTPDYSGNADAPAPDGRGSRP
ncbi:hypothetical protein Ga0074812_14018 [Parafrankia irregularis]|uniref:CU044_5270 family protein n=1 Tax=Parafrankia irregularis TaxID=795642 RepID=A0A0S4R0Y9_9ACTN|nr:CU044_5270 family protein [Parafrankia sp. CH37]CUU60442.1 hypothetical protein Ga0074812_14018 [Parafrankia irregularis]